MNLPRPATSPRRLDLPQLAGLLITLSGFALLAIDGNTILAGPL